MYLFEKQNDSFIRYELVPNKDKIKKFKYDEMNTFSIGERVLLAETNDKEVLNNLFYNGINCVNYNVLNYTKNILTFIKKYHKLYSYDDYEFKNNKKINISSYINSLLEKYYEGNLDNGYLLKISGSYEEYLLIDLCNNSYKYNNYPIKTLDNIISLTKPLYNFHKFSKGKYDEINEDELNYIISLYDVNSIIELNKLSHEFKDMLEKRVEEQTKILKLIK